MSRNYLVQLQETRTKWFPPLLLKHSDVSGREQNVAFIQHFKFYELHHRSVRGREHHGEEELEKAFAWYLLPCSREATDLKTVFRHNTSAFTGFIKKKYRKGNFGFIAKVLAMRGCWKLFCLMPRKWPRPSGRAVVKLEGQGYSPKLPLMASNLNEMNFIKFHYYNTHPIRNFGAFAEALTNPLSQNVNIDSRSRRCGTNRGV